MIEYVELFLLFCCGVLLGEVLCYHVIRREDLKLDKPVIEPTPVLKPVWQPMETAPKDGRVFAIYRQHQYVGSFKIGNSRCIEFVRYVNFDHRTSGRFMTDDSEMNWIEVEKDSRGAPFYFYGWAEISDLPLVTEYKRTDPMKAKP